MTKTELKGTNAPELREILSNHFEGITEDTTKDEMTDLIDEHWDDWLEEAVNEEEQEEEVTEEDERLAFLKKDLYTGLPPR